VNLNALRSADAVLEALLVGLVLADVFAEGFFEALLREALLREALLRDVLLRGDDVVGVSQRMLRPTRPSALTQRPVAGLRILPFSHLPDMVLLHNER